MAFFKMGSFEENENSSLLDQYSNKVFKLVVMIVPIFFIGGNSAMTILHSMGMYPAINDVAMWVSNSIDIGFIITGIILVRTSYGPDGFLIPKKLPLAKIIMMLMVVIQWNLNSYICPFTDFWAYAPLFVILQAFFFDLKIIRLSTFLILGSMLISWFINGEILLPVRNEFFTLNIVFRVIALSFTLLTIYIVTWFGKVFIIEVVAINEKERKIREKSDEYEREARMKSDFLANMSHEIRTPMNAVIGMAEIAMREDLPPAAVDCLTQIQKSGRNLLNIINDILDYSKIDSGKMEIMPENYEPASELHDISNILATRIGEKELHLYFLVDPDIPHELFGDAMRIRQILINLTNNAIKFTQEGSVSVIVTCERVDEETVNVTYHIKDTGIGIKEEDLGKLFVSFQQVDSRRNRSVEGTGLGLVISQRLVEAMGGSVGVDSVYGKGSDFWFTIPQKIVDPTPDLVIEKAEKKRCILLENDTCRAELVAEDLKRTGVEPCIISNVDEYPVSSEQRDYLFFSHTRYDDSVKTFLKKNINVTGIIVIDFNSNYKADLTNLHTLRRPITTPKLVRVLNDNEDTQLYEDEAYTINFTAPDAKILIVDDNAINITIAEGLLSPMDMQIDSALSGAEAIKKVESDNYDIVLMDHMMPGMDGVDTTKYIREKVQGGDKVTIIALSANALKEAKDMFLEVGMNDFVAKPIEIKELVAKIRKWLPDEKIHKGEVKKRERSSDPLAGLEMLDTTQAVKALGSAKLLRLIIEEYYKDGQQSYDEILTAYENEQYKDYTIKVHALKSSSRQIGALELGDKAETLEKAGKANDIDFIKANTEDMLAMFKSLLDSLAPAFPEEDEDEKEKLPPLSDELKTEILDKLRAACDDFDMDVMEEAAKELRGYSWPAEIRNDLGELCEAIDRMEVITVEDVLARIRF